MKWNIFVAAAALFMLTVLFVTASTEHVFKAEAVADNIAPLIGANRNTLRVLLETELGKRAEIRAAVYSGPLALLTALLVGRVIYDVVSWLLARLSAKRRPNEGRQLA